MKKITALYFASIIAVLFCGYSYARITGGTGQNDILCVGPAGSEDCFDPTGNIIPTTTGIESLGSSSLKFQNLYLSGSVNSSSLVSSGPLELTPISTTTAEGLIVPIGSISEIQEGSLTNTYNLCVSTANAIDSQVYILVSTAPAGSATVAGACNK